MHIRAIWAWLSGAVLLPALAALLLHYFAPAQFERAWDWTRSVLFPADTRLYPVHTGWSEKKDTWKIYEDPKPIVHESVATLSLVVSTIFPSGKGLEIIPRVTGHDDNDCPRIRVVGAGAPIYVPVQCVVKLEAGTKHTYSIWIQPDPDVRPTPDDKTPSLIKGTIVVRAARIERFD